MLHRLDTQNSELRHATECLSNVRADCSDHRWLTAIANAIAIVSVPPNSSTSARPIVTDFAVGYSRYTTGYVKL
jgi:hypothetical protein